MDPMPSLAVVEREDLLAASASLHKAPQIAHNTQSDSAFIQAFNRAFAQQYSLLDQGGLRSAVLEPLIQAPRQLRQIQSLPAREVIVPIGSTTGILMAWIEYLARHPHLIERDEQFGEQASNIAHEYEKALHTIEGFDMRPIRDRIEEIAKSEGDLLNKQSRTFFSRLVSIFDGRKHFSNIFGVFVEYEQKIARRGFKRGFRLALKGMPDNYYEVGNVLHNGLSYLGQQREDLAPLNKAEFFGYATGVLMGTIEYLARNPEHIEIFEHNGVNDFLEYVSDYQPIFFSIGREVAEPFIDEHFERIMKKYVMNPRYKDLYMRYPERVAFFTDIVRTLKFE